MAHFLDLNLKCLLLTLVGCLHTINRGPQVLDESHCRLHDLESRSLTAPTLFLCLYFFLIVNEVEPYNPRFMSIWISDAPQKSPPNARLRTSAPPHSGLTPLHLHFPIFNLTTSSQSKHISAVCTMSQDDIRSSYPPYTPMSSLGRELGITFAFIGACLVTIAIYSVFWRGTLILLHGMSLAYIWL